MLLVGYLLGRIHIVLSESHPVGFSQAGGAVPQPLPAAPRGRAGPGLE